MPDFIATLERALAGSVGAATAPAMVGQITGGLVISVEEFRQVAGETARIIGYAAQLEAQSAQLGRTLLRLRSGNQKLTAPSVQKDAFLSQISHELRTPMTSIRASSEILRYRGDMTEAERGHFSGVIHNEAVRLTRLLDDLLYLCVLEAGQVTLRPGVVDLGEVLDRAQAAARGTGALELRRGSRLDDPVIVTDPDRLAQVHIHLIGNAAKDCDAPVPRLTVETRGRNESVAIDFNDNGAGVPEAQTALIFEKFARAGDTERAGGEGFGLAISREIMARPGGDIAYLPDRGGTASRRHACWLESGSRAVRPHVRAIQCLVRQLRHGSPT